MNNIEEVELKKEFQLERIILFSDAVFAIIITIMVIELKLPDSIRDASREEFLHEFKKLAVHLLGYVISFFFVARFWTRHLTLFSFLKDYNSRLLFYNLLFLFTVSMFPFAVTLITGFVHPETIQARWGFNIYLSVILMCMFMFTLLAGYMVNSKNSLCFSPDLIEERLKWKALKANYWLIPLIFILLVVLNILHVLPVFSVYIMAFYGVIMSRLQRKYYPNAVINKPFLMRMFGRKRK